MPLPPKRHGIPCSGSYGRMSNTRSAAIRSSPPGGHSSGVCPQHLDDGSYGRRVARFIEEAHSREGETSRERTQDPSWGTRAGATARPLLSSLAYRVVADNIRRTAISLGTPKRARRKTLKCPKCARRFSHPLPMARHMSATTGREGESERQRRRPRRRRSSMSRALLGHDFSGFPQKCRQIHDQRSRRHLEEHVAGETSVIRSMVRHMEQHSPAGHRATIAADESRNGVPRQA